MPRLGLRRDCDSLGIGLGLDGGDSGWTGTSVVISDEDVEAG